MPWCPKCKNEYVEGITVCADCGTKLVDELPVAEETQVEEMDGIRYEVTENGENSEEEKPRKYVHAYVEKSTQHEDMKSSGYSFLFVGGLAIILAGLIFTGIIPLNVADFTRYLYTVVSGVIGIVFLFVGKSSMKSAKRLETEIGEEDSLNDEITAYFKSNFVEPVIPEDTPEEEIYFTRNEAIISLLNEKFPELDESYKDYIADKLYAMVFEGK